jgi:4-diphosphocytidyl-2-C-methyl-D-erythritol kinase
MKKTSSASQNPSFSLKAPAKINWILNILDKRNDGYHNIISLMQRVSIYDNLNFEHADGLEIKGDTDIQLHDNLIFKAASLLKHHTAYRKGARINFHKNIPVSAGLGGGSSDAAYTLLGLNRLWNLKLNNNDLCKIGLEIGSDIPFFFNGPLALVEGRGENVTPLNLNLSVNVILLVKPPLSVSSAWAYSSFDKFRIGELTKKPLDIKLFCQSLVSKDFTSLNTMINNDLEKVVIEEYPVVKEIKERLLENGALFSSMTGSGPTVFGVFEGKKTVLLAADKMAPDMWCRIAATMI